ncbi:MAG: hypothetical protein ACE5G0_13165 [Rhodothermales bacterium]
MRDVDVRKVSDIEGQEASSSGAEHRHRRRRRRKRRLSVPAPLVFYLSTALAAASTGLVYVKGDRFLGVLVGAELLILAVLIINERSNFARSKRLRRSYESRVNFNKLEIVILFALFMLGFFVGVVAWAA